MTTSDIMQRLYEESLLCENYRAAGSRYGDPELYAEGADEIKRLRAQVYEGYFVSSKIIYGNGTIQLTLKPVDKQ